MEMNHHHTSGIGESGEGMPCHLCGATGDCDGRKFINPSRLLEHLRKAHPEAVSTPRFPPPPPVEPTQAYPMPGSAPRRAAVPPPPVSHARFCPQCGFNMEPIEAAMRPPHRAHRGED
jgi:hypothetical protein